MAIARATACYDIFSLDALIFITLHINADARLPLIDDLRPAYNIAIFCAGHAGNDILPSHGWRIMKEKGADDNIISKTLG